VSLENVEQAVLAEAGKEAELLLAAARQKLAGRLAAEKREIDSRAESRRRRELAHLEGEQLRELSRERTAARLAVLAEKNRLVEEVFRRALAALAGLSPDRFLALAEKWLAEVPTDLAGEIIAGPRERASLAGGFLDRINAGRTGRLSLAEETLPPASGGGLLVRAGRFEFDFTWAGRLADRRAALTGTIAAELFGETGKP
jgi:vacuolar-type H+-ATPase subunit E/Vma4